MKDVLDEVDRLSCYLAIYSNDVLQSRSASAVITSTATMIEEE